MPRYIVHTKVTKNGDLNMSVFQTCLLTKCTALFVGTVFLYATLGLGALDTAHTADLIPSQKPFVRAQVPYYLWKVSAPHGPVSYIFGTLHVGDAMLGAIPPLVVKLLKACDVFVSELWLGPETYDEMQKARLAIKPDKNRFGSKVKDEIAKILKIKPSEVDRIPSSVIYSFLTSTTKEIVPRSNNPMARLWESEMQTIATYDGKTMMQLETPRQQVEILDAYFNSDVVSAYIKTEPSLANALVRETIDNVNNYLRSNDKGLEVGLHRGSEVRLLHANSDTLFTKRNYQWAQKLDKAMRKNSIFLTVGVGHTLGQGSLIDFLRKKGFIIKRVTDA